MANNDSLFSGTVAGLEKATETLKKNVSKAKSKLSASPFKQAVDNYVQEAATTEGDENNIKKTSASSREKILVALDATIKRVSAIGKGQASILKGIEAIDQTDFDDRHELIMQICLTALAAGKERDLVLFYSEIEEFKSIYNSMYSRTLEETFKQLDDNPKKLLKAKVELYRKILNPGQDAIRINPSKRLLKNIIETSTTDELKKLLKICKKRGAFPFDSQVTDLSLATASALLGRIVTRLNNRLAGDFNKNSLDEYKELTNILEVAEEYTYKRVGATESTLENAKFLIAQAERVRSSSYKIDEVEEVNVYDACAEGVIIDTLDGQS